MSKAEATDTISLLDPTRQQLDDLEQLLSRMLKIPVLDLPEGPAIKKLPKIDVKEATTTAVMTLQGSETIEPARELALSIPEVQIAALPTIATAEGPARPVEEGMPGTPATPETTAARIAPRPAADVSSDGHTANQGPKTDPQPFRVAPSGQRSRPPHRPWIYAPLVPVNWTFDMCTLPLGPVGRWLRCRAGRDLAGWVGLLLMLGASAWAGMEMGLAEKLLP
jgi:hypothetical protein